MADIVEQPESPSPHDSKLWRYLGAMMTEQKAGRQAVSINRILIVLCFLYMTAFWMKALVVKFDVIEKAAQVDTPENLMYVFFALIGGKTAESATAIWKGKKGE